MTDRKLPEWPAPVDYYSDGTPINSVSAYERDSAAAAMARLRLAVDFLQRVAEAADTHERHYEPGRFYWQGEASDIVDAIGPLPPEER